MCVPDIMTNRIIAYATGLGQLAVQNCATRLSACMQNRSLGPTTGILFNRTGYIFAQVFFGIIACANRYRNLTKARFIRFLITIRPSYRADLVASMSSIV